MASNPPSDCCGVYSLHEGTPIGKFQEVCGLDTYVVGGESERVIVILTDVYGNHFNNTLLVADELSRGGYKVLIPDILLNDPIGPDLNFPKWLAAHPRKITSPIVDGFLAKVRSELNPKFLVGIGYCYGGRYVIQQLAEGKHFDAGAVAHPSFVHIEEVKGIKRPILISAAETDIIFPAELRRLTEDELYKMGVRYQLDLFSGVEHGFAIKGDMSNPAVKYAKEKVVKDQVYFFDNIYSLIDKSKL
ncbi:Protein AIM2 [Spathaspora sp. JA1]|nr:Protein AIM2 [Spathaspora sp. JA1]